MGFMHYINQVVSFKKRVIFDRFRLEFSPSPPINANFYWMGYETMTFVENLGFLTFLLILLVVRSIFGILFYYLEKACKSCACLKTKRDLLVSSPSESIRMWMLFLLITYFEFLISCFSGAQIHDYLPQEVTLADQISMKLSSFFKTIVFMFPLTVLISIWLKTRREKRRRT